MPLRMEAMKAMKLAVKKAAAAALAKKEIKAMKSTASVTHLSNMKASDEPHIDNI